MEINQNAILLLGSNLGAKMDNLDVARLHISREIGEINDISSVYETQAWGETNQPSFFNQVISVSTADDPHTLLEKILRIEKKMGRERKEKWKERIVDIDILYYGSMIESTSELIIPHNQLHKRRFTLVPLVEILPDFMHPVFKKTNAELLKETEDLLEVTKLF